VARSRGPPAPALTDASGTWCHLARRAEIHQQPPDWQSPWVALEYDREHLLFEGTLDDVLDEPPGWDHDHWWNPAWAYLWAIDESWLTTTGIDAYSTYVLGPLPLIDDILADERLIAHRVDRDVPLPMPTAPDQEP